MHNNKRIPTRAARLNLLLAALLLGAASGASAADSAAGQGLYAACASCHGQSAQGNAALKAPALAGQSAAYLARQLNHFKTGVRGGSGDTQGAQMAMMAGMLADDSAVENVAAYIAGLPVVAAPATVEGDAVAGNKLYQSYCGACHGSNGQGNDALNAPRLAGLSDAYVILQFQNFRAGIRGEHPDDKYGRQMKMMATTLNDAQLVDVAAFLNSRAE